MAEEEQNYPNSYGDHADDYSDQTGDYSKEYDNQYGGYPEGYENQYRESDADYASEHQHKRGKNAHNYRQNASDETWARWEDDVDNGKSSKATKDAVNQRRQGKNKVTAAAGDPTSPQHSQLTEDKTDCLATKKDCAGVCWGQSERDTQGGCCLEHEKDCAGVCFGDSIWINKGGTQYGRVNSYSSQQDDYRCCSRSKDPWCCQTESCNGGCPEEGSGGKAVSKDGKLCMCNPATDKGCCGDGRKDCKNRCPHEEGYGDTCGRYDVHCKSDGSWECQRFSGGKYITMQDCQIYAGQWTSSGHYSIACANYS